MSEVCAFSSNRAKHLMFNGVEKRGNHMCGGTGLLWWLWFRRCRISEGNAAIQGAGGESPPPPRARPRFQEGGGGNGGWWHGTANTATFPLFPRRFPAPPPPPPTSPPFFSASGSSPPFPKSAGVFYELLAGRTTSVLKELDLTRNSRRYSAEQRKG